MPRQPLQGNPHSRMRDDELLPTEGPNARQRFNTLAHERWTQGRALYGDQWKGRHPLREMAEEMADAFNYLLVWRSARGRVTVDMIQTVEALGATVMAMMADLEADGVDLTVAPPSLASCILPSCFVVNTPRKSFR